MDEGDLSYYILPIDIFDLFLADHGYRFILLKGASNPLERAEAQVRFDQALDTDHPVP